MIYGFVPRLTQTDIAALIMEGDRIALLERARRGLPVLAPLPPRAAVVLGAGQPAFAAVVGALDVDFEPEAFCRAATVVCQAHALTVAAPLEEED
eukprot:7558634-Heterocapsa_arctica.AAC.1